MSGNINIIGSGSFLPEKILTNVDLEKMVETSDVWIKERTGIAQRHIAGEGELTSDLAVKAAERAILDAKINKEEVGLIIVASTTPDRTFPSTAVIVQQKLGLKHSIAFDIQAVCTGFVYGLSVADSLMKNSNIKYALVIGAETLSRIVDWTDRNTCVLFGDGAGAVVLEKTEKKDEGILSFDLNSDGGTVEILCTTGGVSSSKNAGFITMEGKEVFKHAITKLSESSIKTIEAAGKKIEEIDWVIPHQANQRILDGVVKKLDVGSEKLVSTVAEHANTSAASIPLAFDNYRKAGKIKKGDLLSIQAIGGGLTWGSLVVKL